SAEPRRRIFLEQLRRDETNILPKAVRSGGRRRGVLGTASLARQERTFQMRPRTDVSLASTWLAMVASWPQSSGTGAATSEASIVVVPWLRWKSAARAS